jgi:hypothetical protein
MYTHLCTQDNRDPKTLLHWGNQAQLSQRPVIDDPWSMCGMRVWHHLFHHNLEHTNSPPETPALQGS